MKKAIRKWALGLVLAASLMANAYYYVQFIRTVPAHAICSLDSDRYRLFGDASERFKIALASSPFSYSAISHPLRPGTQVEIPAWRVSRFWSHDEGWGELINSSQQFLRQIEEENGATVKQMKPNCKRMARWLFKPVGKPKTLSCSDSTCRVLGVKKTPPKKG